MELSLPELFALILELPALIAGWIADQLVGLLVGALLVGLWSRIFFEKRIKKIEHLVSRSGTPKTPEEMKLELDKQEHKFFFRFLGLSL